MKSYTTPLTSQEIEWKRLNRLEKAAPDLLSALDLLLDKVNVHFPDAFQNAFMQGAIERAEMAIAKAKGGAA